MGRYSSTVAGAATAASTAEAVEELRLVKNEMENSNEKLDRLLTQAALVTGLDLKPGDN